MDRIENDASNSSSIVACLFIAAVNVFTELLPSNDGRIHIQTHRLMGFVKYTTEMVSGAMIYIPSFIKIGSAIQKLIRGNTSIHSIPIA
jgi:prolyl-tRNA synthetase